MELEENMDAEYFDLYGDLDSQPDPDINDGSYLDDIYDINGTENSETMVVSKDAVSKCENIKNIINDDKKEFVEIDDELLNEVFTPKADVKIVAKREETSDETENINDKQINNQLETVKQRNVELEVRLLTFIIKT
jgi:hypothetical protein